MAPKKRGKAGAAAATAAAEAEDPAPELPIADLDLSSSDEDEHELGENGDVDSSTQGDTDEQEEGDDDEEEPDEELREALADYLQTAAAPRRRQQRRGDDSDGSDGSSDGSSDGGSDEDGKQQQRRSQRQKGKPANANGDGDAGAAAAANGGGGANADAAADEDSDSSEDERPNRNTVGAVPLEWYKDEDHVGYDLDGAKIARRARADRLDALLARQDGGAALRTIYDEYNDEEIVLTKEEIGVLMRIRRGQLPSLEADPFPEYNDFASRDVEAEPIVNMPEPKRRFVPSKWEEQKVVKLVRAIRNGWLKTRRQKEAERKKGEGEVYLLWGDDDQAAGEDASKTGAGLTYIPAAKPKLPGHEESYNPPKEYLPTEEERTGWQLLDEEDRPKFVPQGFDAMRRVPAYASFVQERFERCLDLYLCPRVSLV